MIYLKRLIIVTLITFSCQSLGKLKFEADIANNLKEVSAIEVHSNSIIKWVIEDSGNANNLYGLNSKGQIVRNIDINNAYNRDWEDLTIDALGNIYIGDFGNNSRGRKQFSIYKIKQEDLKKDDVTAEVISFTLPKQQDSEDFEAFFIHNNAFYIFSKSSKKFAVMTVPNIIGNHVATLSSEYDLEGKKNKITSADITKDGKIIVLLNHDKLWKLTDFDREDFFSGKVEALLFGHYSQKEGICFSSNNEVLITDEQQAVEGGNIYSFSL